MSENPYQSTDTEATAAPHHKAWFTPGGVILGLVAIGITVALLLPTVRSARPSAHRSQCTNNTKQIMLALFRYEQEHGSLPPAYTVDEQGSRLHSWRTLILPYMEQQMLYDRIDLTKPWDDPVNANARESVVYAYTCPSTSPDDPAMTTYLAVVGPEAAFPGTIARTSAELEKERQNTLAIIDATPDKAVHWMSPQDITIDEVLRFSEATDTQHPGGMVAGFLHGGVDFIYLDIDREVLRSMLTIADDMPEHLKPSE
jgi:hypothetical protein